MDNLYFGIVLIGLKEGMKFTRKGWNGKDMFIYLTNASIVPVVCMKPETANHLFGGQMLEGDATVTINSHIDMKTADGSITIGWTPSQVDMFAEDWMEVK